MTANAIADAKKLKKILAAMRNLVNMHAFACLILTGVTGIYISEGWSENPAWFNTIGVLIALFWFWQAVNAVKASGMAKAMENLIDQKLAGR